MSCACDCMVGTSSDRERLTQQSPHSLVDTNMCTGVNSYLCYNINSHHFKLGIRHELCILYLSSSLCGVVYSKQDGVGYSWWGLFKPRGVGYSSLMVWDIHGGGYSSLVVWDIQASWCRIFKPRGVGYSSLEGGNSHTDIGPSGLIHKS